MVSVWLNPKVSLFQAKGLFILDKINGRPEDEIKEEMRACCTDQHFPACASSEADMV